MTWHSGFDLRQVRASYRCENLREVLVDTRDATGEIETGQVVSGAEHGVPLQEGASALAVDS